jgi:chromosome segregation ATPase
MSGLHPDLDLAQRTIEAQSKWIAEAKPLLERGGQAERDLAELRAKFERETVELNSTILALRSELGSEQQAHDQAKSEIERLNAELEEWQTTFEGWGETPKAAHDKIVKAAMRDAAVLDAIKKIVAVGKQPEAKP